ncbi:MAG: TlpA disulfide reductase family protein [Bacteroidota bacterium]
MKAENVAILIAWSLVFWLIPVCNISAQSGPDRSMSLDQFAGQALQEKDEVWVVDFWASWCGPCIRAVPHMKEVHERVGGESVRFISISWDRNPAKWQSALERLRMPWQHIIVPKGQKAFLDEHFPHATIPTVFVIDRVGQVKKVTNVYRVEKAIKKALK